MPAIPRSPVWYKDRGRGEGEQSIVQRSGDSRPVGLPLPVNIVHRTIGFVRMRMRNNDRMKKQIFGKGPRVESDVHGGIEGWRRHRCCVGDMNIHVEERGGGGNGNADEPLPFATTTSVREASVGAVSLRASVTDPKGDCCVSPEDPNGSGI